jgi:NodT family efflux transporter outer membrane factor (OMF) lipoprotein
MRAGRLHRGLVGALVVALVAAGCTVGPNYVRPPVVTPDAYKEADGWKKAEPQDYLPRGLWWEAFGDTQLDALERRVNVSNQNLRVAEAQFSQARAVVREARAAFFPTMTVGLGYTRFRQSETLSTSNNGGVINTVTPTRATSPTSFFQFPIDVAWEVDLWGRIRRTVESNQASAQASAGDLEAARLSFHAELALDYFQLQTLDAEKELLDASVVAFEKALELTKNRYAEGIASRADVVQAEAQLKQTQAQAVDVGVQRAQLEHAIAVLMGEPPSALTLAATPLTGEPPRIPLGVPSQLLERRPDIAAAERRMQAANAQIGVALAAFYPTVTLSASAGFQSSSVSQWFTWPSRFWSVGPAISETVFDGGLRRAQTDFARAGFQSSVATYRQTVLTAFQSVEDNLAALRILAEENRVQDEAVATAQQSVTLTTNQYKAGTVSYLNVITAQTIYLSDEVTAVQIRGRRMAAAVALIQALGGGWNESELPSTKEVTQREAPAAPQP